MIVRIVRMTFRPDGLGAFMDLFDTSAPKIRRFPGCLHLELWRDERFGNILTTYSHWQSAGDLERYRTSPLFEDAWSRTKPLFAAAPTAHSYTLAREASFISANV